MPYSSATVCGNILKAIFRTAHTSDFPSTYYVALFDGDPEAGGVEPDSTGGYARLAVANTNAEFTISGDTVTNVNDWVWPTSSAGYQTGHQTLSHWALYDNSSGGSRILSGRIAPGGTIGTIVVNGSGLIPKILAGQWSWKQKAA